ncbi:MAG: energy-coupling factor transporter transmembrane protein EcfT, partial [bacterium]|nr:energy-coupling factor transporter transmembrane protein EcfT [bacterium]
MPLAIAINAAFGWAAATLKLPIYLDSLGTILVGAAAGPWAGCLTGILSIIVSAINSPIWMLYIPCAAFIGIAAGIAVKCGMMRTPWRIIATGILTGILSACIAAPITAYILGGATGAGTDLIVAGFQALSLSKLSAVLAQSLITDPIDKVVCFMAVGIVIGSLPQKLRGNFPQGAYLSGIKTWHFPHWHFLRTKSANTRRKRLWEPSLQNNQASPTSPRLSPSVKILFLITAFVSAILVNFTGIIITLAILVFLGFTAKIGGLLIKSLLAAGLPLGISMIIINACFNSGGMHIYGPFYWYYPGAHYAVLLTLRILILLSACILVLNTTKPHELIRPLENCGMPAKLCYVVISALNLLPFFMQRADDILDAQTSRGLAVGKGLSGNTAAIMPLAGPLLLGAMADAEQRALAMEARGFGAASKRTYLADPPSSALDRPAQLLLTIILALLIANKLMEFLPILGG